MARRPPSAAIGPLLPVICIAAIAILPAAEAFAPCVGFRCASPLPTSQARRPPSLTRILALDPFTAAAALGSTHAAAKRLILESVALVHPHQLPAWGDWRGGLLLDSSDPDLPFLPRLGLFPPPPLPPFLTQPPPNPPP